MSQHGLHSLLAPKSITVLTGNRADNPILLALLAALAQGGKTCPVSLVGVTPQWEKIDQTYLSKSAPQYKSLYQLETPCDLAILAGSTQSTLKDIVADCSQAGIGSLLVLTGGHKINSSLISQLRKYNVRLLGPNSFGICRPKQGVLAWLGLTQPIVGRLALMSQSGTVASALVDWASWQGIGFSQVVTMGSQVDVMPSQILDFLSNDYESQSILMYLQKIGNPTRFLSSLRAASRTKPVAVVTEHNAGADPKVLDAALSRTGAVRGHRLNDLVAAASVMTNARRIHDGSLMIIGNGAGPSELAAQRASEINVALLEPGKELTNELDLVIQGRGRIGSVTTVWASGKSDIFTDLAAIALKDNQCCAVLLMLSPTALLDMSSLVEQVMELHKQQRKLVMVCLLGGGEIVAMRTQLNAASIPTFRTPESAMEGFQFLEQFQRNQQLAKQSPDSHAFSQQIDVDKARSQLQKLIKDGYHLPELEDLRDIFNLFHIRLSARRQANTILSIPIHIRVFRDPVFGPIIGLATGRTGYGKNQNEVIGLPPLNTLLVKNLIKPLFADEECYELENLLLNLSTLVCELPEIEQLELSNIRLHETGSLFADINCRLELCKHRRYEHLAIQPYPRQWVTHFTLKNGQQATVRPVRPEDAPMMADFVRSLSSETRYFRFISSISELTPRMLATMSHIDYDREMAFMAVLEQEGNDQLIGTARYSDNFDDNSCEFAVVLGDDYQGLGLASYLMKQLFRAAADKGIKLMEGVVLVENKRMIDFCKHLGFSIKKDPDDIGQVIASLKLTPSFIQALEPIEPVQ